MAEKKRRFNLQPSFSRKKEEESPADRPHPEAKLPEDRHPSEGRHEREKASDDAFRESSPSGRERMHGPMQDKRLLLGIAGVIVVLAAIMIILWLYPLSQPAPSQAVTDSQVRSELQRVAQLSTLPENKNLAPSDYPKVFGTWNGRTLIESYFCSDVCPDYARVDLIFQGVDNEQCGQVGGRSLHDLAWGGYIGCQPVVA